ncbi:hypothetical protein J2847_001665 [Azospirillum agricola]|uniref:hypothetical protein n=1 Tax=Azospirillum agricola TaxID=1720247 RepID=UPI001F3A54E8|nr:hypothetical protein [Azospirillum agricola]MBP2228383.1 hypothetical protein [Azospirillum agricola]
MADLRNIAPRTAGRVTAPGRAVSGNPAPGSVADTRFAALGRPRHVWAVGAIHAQPGPLDAIHHAIAERFQPGDRLVYLGNMVGHGERALDTIDRLLAFRRALLSRRGMLATDIVYLRGAQEEMWQKLLQLHFAPDPRHVLDWMLRQGVGPTLAAYGGTPDAGMAAARGGTVMLGRWTRGLRQAVQARPGHEALFNALRRAAYTGGADGGGDADGDGNGNGNDGGGPDDARLLLVSAGIDPARPLTGQGDAFWWGGNGFARLDASYGAFRRLVRGFDPARRGLAAGPHTITLDGGCGFGGPLVCARLDSAGEPLELLQA